MNDAWLLVVADMAARRGVGLELYGKPVTPDASEDWLQHAYEEALDLAVYLRAEIERRKAKTPRGVNTFSSSGGKAAAAKMTTDQRRERAQKAANARWNKRTVADVMAARSTVVGCCDRHADNKACDCLDRAKSR